MQTRGRVAIAGVDIRPEDIRAVARVLESGRLRQGAVTAGFEERFAERVGAKYAVSVSSGTAALHLAYLALFTPGDKVIVPALTFVATASMLLAVGVEPIFADVDPRTFTLSVEDARSRIDEGTRGIVGVHLFGNACDVEGISRLAEAHDLTVVWDAAQALGTMYRGRDVGVHPTAVCYSFYPTKIITTGEGGMVVTDDPDLAHRVRLLRSQGASARYVHTAVGFNYRMTDFQAALGQQQLIRLQEYLDCRRSNARFLTAELQRIPGILTPGVTKGTLHSFNQYSILIDPQILGKDRDRIMRDLEARDVEGAIHYPRPLHHQPIFEKRRYLLPHSERVTSQILSLPVHPGLEAHDLERVVGALVWASEHG
jgi:perosamine synthetase